MVSSAEKTGLVSVVIPVYRSAEILPDLVRQLCVALSNFKFEIVLVCDASPDRSWDVICELRQHEPNVVGVLLRRNAGQHNAIMAGLNYCAGDMIVMMDDDLQHPPADIPRLLAALQSGADVCYVKYRNRKHALWKRLGSKFNDMAATILLGKPSGLYLSSFKAIKKPILEQVIKYNGPFSYVDGLILDSTSRVVSVEIDHQERMFGESGYTLRKLLSLWLKMATSFSVFPLRLLFLVGTIVAIVSVALAFYVVINKYLDPSTPTGWTSLIATVLFVGGVQILGLGLLGEYLGRAYLKLNGKPQFVVREVIGEKIVHN